MKRRKLRRLGILDLVLVLLSNTIGAQAGAPDVTVSSYEELIQAIEQASNLDTILITGVISIPEESSLGNTTKTVTLKSSGGYLEVIGDPEKEEITTLTSLIFDGAELDLLAPYLRIEAEGMDLVYEYTAEGVNVSISSPEAPESPTEAMVVNTSSPLTETPQEADKSPNWVECVSMILLAVLVVLEIRDKVKPHKEG